MECVRNVIGTCANLDYQRFFCLNCFLWHKEMHILAGNCDLGFLVFTAPKILAG